MFYSIIKSLHIIFMVCWFAGLFYIVRLFVYLAELEQKPKEERLILSKQLNLMTKRLWYIITWPSAVLTILFGLKLLVMNSLLLKEPWMHVKLSFIILLCLYHLWCGYIRKQFDSSLNPLSSKRYRLLNELPTIVLISVVFLAVTKSTAILIPVLLTVLCFGLLAMIVSRLLKV